MLAIPVTSIRRDLTQVAGALPIHASSGLFAIRIKFATCSGTSKSVTGTYFISQVFYNPIDCNVNLNLRYLSKWTHYEYVVEPSPYQIPVLPAG
jgi:hypothetical protein